MHSNRAFGQPDGTGGFGAGKAFYQAEPEAGSLHGGEPVDRLAQLPAKLPSASLLERTRQGGRVVHKRELV